MPVIGAVTGGLDFTNYFIPLSSKVTADSLVEAKKQGAVLAWGNFLTIVINFIIIAWVLFLMVKLMNRIMPKKRPRRRPTKAGAVAHRNPRSAESAAQVAALPARRSYTKVLRR